MSEHTPEPWILPSEIIGEDRIIESEDMAVIATVHTYTDFGKKPARDANARRIVVCVNACKGISTETLENNCIDIARDAVAMAIKLFETRQDLSLRYLENARKALGEHT